MKLRPFRLKSSKVVLPNGITVRLHPNRELPLVSAQVTSLGGSAFDPADKRGLAATSMGLLLQPSARRASLPPGAGEAAYAEDERVTIACGAMTNDFEKAFASVSERLLRRHVDDRALEQSKHVSPGALDPEHLASKATRRALFGTHPYANSSRTGAAQIESLSPDDLRGFYAHRLGPRISHVVLAGDFEPEEAVTMVQQHLGRWVGGPASPPLIEPWRGPAPEGRVVVVDHRQSDEVHLRIAGQSAPRGHPDGFAISVMNQLLGATHTSRLAREARTKRALTYWVESGVRSLQSAGLLEIVTSTSLDQTASLVRVVIGEVRKLKERGARKGEVEAAKRSIVGMFPARFETNESIVGILGELACDGLSTEYVEEYRERVEAVTAAQVSEAAHRHLFEEARVVVAVGNAEVLAPLLAEFGALTILSEDDFR